MTKEEALEHAKMLKEFCRDRDNLDDPCEDCPFHFYGGLTGLCVLNYGLYPNEWFKPQAESEDIMTREEAIHYGKDYLKDLTTACCHIEDKHKDFVRMSIKALEQEPKIGHWIDRFPAKECKCSVCDFLICISNGLYVDMVDQMKYCPNCGAKMGVD